MANLSIYMLTLSLLPALIASFSPENPTDRRILVLLDDLSLKSSHSIFFNSLQARAFHLDFKLADDPSLSLQRYGQYSYDALILFSPATESMFRFTFSMCLCTFRGDLLSFWLRFVVLFTGFGGSLDLAAILDFADSGHDVIVAADENASDLIRNIASECGVDFDEVNFPLIFFIH